MSETRTVDPGRAKRKDEGFYASVQDALKEVRPVHLRLCYGNFLTAALLQQRPLCTLTDDGPTHSPTPHPSPPLATLLTRLPL
jgi:hypothetical protein